MITSQFLFNEFSSIATWKAVRPSATANSLQSSGTENTQPSSGETTSGRGNDKRIEASHLGKINGCGQLGHVVLEDAA